MLDSILLKLSRPDPSNRQLLATIDYLHDIFEVPSMLSSNGKIIHPYRLTAISISKKAFQCLVDRLVEQLLCKQSQPVKKMRNETAFLVCLFSSYFHKAKKYLLDYVMIIAFIINQGILGRKEIDSDSDFHLDSSPEDLELLQYCMYLLKCIVEIGKGEKIINELKIASALLTLVLDPSRVSKGVTDLERAAWGTLHAIAKRYPKSLIRKHGATLLLDFLKAYGKNAGKEDDSYTLSMAMHLIRIMLSSQNPPMGCVKKVPNIVERYFNEQEGMAAFLDVIRHLLLKEKLDAVGKVTVCNALFSCSILGMSDRHQKKVFYSLAGISTLTMVMTMKCLLNDQTSVDSMLKTAVSECICSCVAYDADCLEEFLANVGIFMLVDLLQLCEDPTTSAHLTSCLLQLCDYPRCRDQLLYWSRTIPCTDRVVFGYILDTGVGHIPRSGVSVQELGNTSCNSCKGLASLLCALWKREETGLKVLRDPDGCIASLTNPLMSLLSITLDAEVLTEDVRAMSNLYRQDCIRHKLFVLAKSIVEKTKTEAIFFDGLSLINQVIMTCILNYHDLKVAEIRIECISALHRRGFSNRYGAELAKMLTISKNRVSTIMELQRYLVRRHREKEATSEYEFYSMMKLCKLQDHLMAAKEIEFMARTTNYKFLLANRLWQKSELENVANGIADGVFRNSSVHRTSDGHLNITAFTIQTKSVQSEPSPNDISLDDFENSNDQKLREDKVKRIDTISQLVQGQVAPLGSVTNSEINSPAPLEGGFYQLSPYFLKEELEKIQSLNKEWLNSAIDKDVENGWKVRLKWKQDWYPLH